MDQVRLIPGASEWRLIDDEVVLLHVPQMRYVAINAAGSHLWPALVPGTTVPRLAEELAHAFGITYEQALGDGEAFVARLCDEGIAERF